MKIVTAQKFWTLDGTKPIMGPGDTPIDFRTVAITAVLTEAKASNTAEKVERGMLALKLQTAGDEVELTVEEAAFIKKLLGESAFTALVVVQAAALLDGKAPLIGPPPAPAS